MMLQKTLTTGKEEFGKVNTVLDQLKQRGWLVCLPSLHKSINDVMFTTLRGSQNKKQHISLPDCRNNDVDGTMRGHLLNEVNER